MQSDSERRRLARNAYQRKRYRENAEYRERCKASTRKRYEIDREYQERYRESHPEKIAEKNRLYYLRHRDGILAKRREERGEPKVRGRNILTILREQGY